MEQHRITCEEEGRYVGKWFSCCNNLFHTSAWDFFNCYILWNFLLQRLKWLRIASLSSKNRSSRWTTNRWSSRTSNAKKKSSRRTLSSTRSSTSTGMVCYRRPRRRTRSRSKSLRSDTHSSCRRIVRIWRRRCLSHSNSQQSSWINARFRPTSQNKRIIKTRTRCNNKLMS